MRSWTFFLGQFGPKSPLALKALAESGRALRIVAYEVSAVPQVITDFVFVTAVVIAKPGFRQKHCEAFTSRCFNAWQNKDDSCSSSLCALRKQSRALSFENRILPYIRHIASPTTFLQRHREKVLQLWSPDRRRRFHPAVEITCFGKAAR